MKQFIVMPEKCRFYTVEAMTAESAYRGVCCWYSPKTPVAIMDSETGATIIFTRELDKAGNLDKIRKAATV